ncbi:MAG: hypothetical protein JWM53_902, partial [bacterium]|nr:hypothetical protein [bacterium]
MNRTNEMANDEIVSSTPELTGR